MSLVRPRRVLSTIGVALWLVLSASCGDDSRSARDGGGAMDAADEDSGALDSGSTRDSGQTVVSDGATFLMRYAESVCAMYAPCCEAETQGYDAAGCIDWFRGVTTAYFRGEYRAEAGNTCLSELATARDTDPNRCASVHDFDQATLRETCSLAFASPLNVGAALGEDCLLSDDCAGTIEDGTVICYGGACLLEQRGMVGSGPCFFGAGDGIEGERTRRARCDAGDGLYCDRSTNTCAPLVDDGGLCPRSDACKSSALCTGGRCVTLPGLGEGCLNAVPGAGGYCRPGSACVVETLTCGTPLEEGAACREASQCASGSCNGTCRPPSFTRALNCTGG